MTTLKVGLIGAMAEEIELIKDKLSDGSARMYAGITFYEGTLDGASIVLCKSGVGKVNAAVCTQLLVDRFAVSHVVFTGVAGALDPRLEIGDIVISTDCMQHDMDVTALGFPRGTIPYEDVSVFAADETLVELAGRAGNGLADGTRVLRGRVLSGDQFIADRELVARLHNELEGACVEMEGAAVAQVCAMNGLPFVVIRSMSDKADGSADVNFLEFTKLASLRSSELVERLLAELHG